MKRTTIVLTDQLALLLERERRRRGVPASVVVRDALEGYFEDGVGPLPIAGLGESGEGHVAANVESILAAEWTYERLMGRPDPRPPIVEDQTALGQEQVRPPWDGEAQPSP